MQIVLYGIRKLSFAIYGPMYLLAGILLAETIIFLLVFWLG